MPLGLKKSRPRRRHAFEFQDTRQTLAEGLAEYHARNAGFGPYRNLSAEARAFFRSHDVIHVVYGCTNALNDEAIVKLSSLFGSKAGLRVLEGYRLHESFQIYARLKIVEVLLTIFKSVYQCPAPLPAV